jgi:hypothetical protein
MAIFLHQFNFFSVYSHNNLKWVKQLAHCLRSSCFSDYIDPTGQWSPACRGFTWNTTMTSDKVLMLKWILMWVISREFGKEEKEKKTHWSSFLFVCFNVTHKVICQMFTFHLAEQKYSYSRMSISFNSKSNMITLLNKHLTRHRHFQLKENLPECTF